MESTQARIREFIDSNFPSGPDGVDYPSTQSLLESGTIDSIGVLSLVVWLEEEFGVAVDDDEVLPENLDSIASIAAFVERKMGTSKGAG